MTKKKFKVVLDATINLFERIAEGVTLAGFIAMLSIKNSILW